MLFKATKCLEWDPSNFGDTAEVKYIESCITPTDDQVRRHFAWTNVRDEVFLEKIQVEALHI